MTEVGKVDSVDYDENDPDKSPFFLNGKRVTKQEMDQAFDNDEPGLYGFGLDAFFD